MSLTIQPLTQGREHKVELCKAEQNEDITESAITRTCFFSETFQLIPVTTLEVVQYTYLLFVIKMQLLLYGNLIYQFIALFQ